MGETCSHVAAMLYKIETAVRMGYTSVTPTDLPCKWNQNFTKNILGSPVSEINLYSDQAKAKLKNIGQKKREVPPLEEFENFLYSLKEAAPKAVGLSLFGDFQEKFITKEKDDVPCLKLIPPLRSIYSKNNLALSAEEYEKLADKTILNLCSHSGSDFVYVEEATRNQAQSFTWYEQRAGRVTGSTVFAVAHSSIEKTARSLVKKLCSDKQSFLNVPALNWGREKENVALEIYKNISSDPEFVPESISLAECFVHSNFEIRPIGLVISGRTPWLAASPDSCVFCSCCEYGVVEVKCPFSLREKSLLQEIDEGNFYVVRDTDGTFMLRESHQYYYQVQLEMYCTDTRYCDFFVWTPAEFVCIRIEKNETFLRHLVETCTRYWKEVVLKELLQRNFEHEDTVANNNDIRTCKKCHSDKDDMLNCLECQSWFHPKCVGRKTLAKINTWTCKSCKAKK